MITSENLTGVCQDPVSLKHHEIDAAMDSLRLLFYEYLGQPCDGNPIPTCGYKLEMDETNRNAYFGKAIRMRNKYAEMVTIYVRGKDTLSKMTHDLTNAHIDASWSR